MIHHHPPFELVFDFAAGTLPEPVALAMAAHAQMCGACRGEIEAFELIGGEMLAGIEPASVSADALEAVMARLDESESAVSTAAAGRLPASEFATAADRTAPPSPMTEMMPTALLAYLGNDLSRLAWRKVGGMFEEIKLPISVKGFKASLMRLKPGSTMPVHTHRGREYTLVLAGGYRDNGSQYGPGDFSLKDPSDVHRPIVDSDEECICLAVLDAPVKLTGIMGRLVNPFLRM